MATASNLRLRRTRAQLHALAGVEREIRANDRTNRRKYLKDYAEAFTSYQSVIHSQGLQGQVQSADTILIGDYHALPASQRFAANLFEQRAHPGDRPVVLAIEAVFARDQHILDEWWRREIGEGELRGRIRFDLDWGYEWAPFYELLVTAREHGEAIYGLDCMPREDLRKIGARDRHAAHKLQELRQRHPNAVLVVLFGESHLAPEHLPRLLRKQMPQERLLTVLQNVDALYWKAAGEQSERVEAVRVGDDIVCVFNATPLEKYESYRVSLARWREEESDAPDLGPTIYNLVDGLVRFLGINRYCSHNGTQPKFLVDMMPEVYSGASDARLQQVLARYGATDEETVNLLRRVEERGSVYLPQANAFYVRDFQMMYATEEVARFLHHACRGLPANRKQHAADDSDRFYAHVMEYAVGYFGSRVLYPARPAVANDEKPRTPKNADESAFDSSSQLLGYMLGNGLYEAYLQGRVSRVVLRHLFLASLAGPGEAKAAYAVAAAKAGSERKSRAAVASGTPS